MEFSESSISFTLSKGGPEEEMSLSYASIEDALEREADRTGRDVISNERIQKGDVILETYTVTSDAISGGMGSVWRTHHENWNVELAMKRPQPRFFAEGGQARKAEFIKECENWIDLGLHPNIVSCYYVREIGGVPTIFSEWMEGGSLRDRIRDGSLYSGTEADIEVRILDIAIQAARGLEYSHAKGLIHQDIKPGNLLLSKDWKAKVADFGLAKARSQATTSLMPLSTGYTPEYCPAEQAQGAPAEQWMDVYAWALAVLEMFAGERAWKTGAEVKNKIKGLLAGCRIPVPDEIGDLLTECVEDKEVSFGKIQKSLLQIYQKITGVMYPRPAFKEAEDTADSLNNRALSFLDLGSRKGRSVYFGNLCEC